jgi:5-formyltetrahydrofolate cyclo-ligase
VADKQQIRERVWALLTRRRAARFPGAKGRIPNFVGAEAAARRLTEMPEWREAKTLKCNPDAPQLTVRRLALEQGKTVFMAVPRLQREQCFLELDPSRLAGREREAASIRGAAALGRPTHPREMPRIDLVVAGSVAVRRDGSRVGKGGGYSDLEFAIAAELGLVGAWTTVVTTVHPLQVVEDEIPMEPHDLPLDRIVTPDDAIVCRSRFARPTGVDWEVLAAEKIEAIPVLAKAAANLRPRRGRRA